MQLDVRLPMGYMFLIIGLILLVYGMVTWTDTAMYERSLGHNVNLWWGLLMTAFGAAMLLLARRAAARLQQNPPAAG
ncbi:MAG: hypothetical protein ACYC6Y_18185 [Thermoguttaceae bacterium]